MNPQDLENLGFPSWLSLYTFLREQGYHESVKVKLIEARKPSVIVDKKKAPPQPQSDGIIVTVEYVKARAFEELYAALPTRDTLDILIETSQEATLKFLDARLITSYLAKQPTRLP